MRLEEYIQEMVNKLTIEEEMILAALEESTRGNALRIKDLMEELKLKSTTIKVAINKFRFVGWVTVVIDRRNYMYYITDLGKDIVDMIGEQY